MWHVCAPEVAPGQNAPQELRRCTMSAGLILNPMTGWGGGGGVIIHCKALWVVSHTRKVLYKNKLFLLSLFWQLPCGFYPACPVIIYGIFSGLWYLSSCQQINVKTEHTMAFLEAKYNSFAAYFNMVSFVEQKKIFIFIISLLIYKYEKGKG